MSFRLSAPRLLSLGALCAARLDRSKRAVVKRRVMILFQPEYGSPVFANLFDLPGFYKLVKDRLRGIVPMCAEISHFYAKCSGNLDMVQAIGMCAKKIQYRFIDEIQPLLRLDARCDHRDVSRQRAACERRATNKITTCGRFCHA
jgi:hypothetical protein